jgi:prevent-host-death family protein
MQTKTVDIHDAKASFDELLNLVREGVEIILTDGGTPLARLTSVETGQRIPDLSIKEIERARVLGLHAHLGTAWMSDDFDDPLPDEFWFGDE